MNYLTKIKDKYCINKTYNKNDRRESEYSHIMTNVYSETLYLFYHLEVIAKV